MAFKAIDDITQSVSGSSARVPIPYQIVADAAGNANPIKVGNKLRLQADGADMYFQIGDATVAATTGDSFLQDNAIEEFQVNPYRDTHIAVIGSSGTLRITVGTGD